MRAIIYPYKFGSSSAKKIAKKLPAIRVRDVGRYRKRNGDFIINWGNTVAPSWGESNLNKYGAVANACNKVTALKIMKEADVRTVEFTDDTDIVKGWLAEGNKVYARTLTRASGGRGIHVVNKGEIIPKAQLYTLGIESVNEYRLHVFNGKVIDYTKKIPLKAEPNSLIKSHDNGWTFARNVARRPSLETEAIKAVTALGLDFGAVDIIINPKNKNRPHILEVNTACGLQEDGRTLSTYTHHINEYVKQYSAGISCPITV